MRVSAIVDVSITTEDVDRTGSIIAAVAERLDADVSQMIDLDDWTWQYESNREYGWADDHDRQPLTGEPYADAPPTA